MSDIPILIVEDEAAVAKLYSDALELNGYSNLTIAESGLDAISVFKEDGHPIVILDYYLGDISGLDVLNTIRDTFPPTQIIMITGAQGTGTVIKALKAGACDFLSKPVSVDIFIHTVQRCESHYALIIENQKYIDELESYNDSLKKDMELNNVKLQKTNTRLNQVIYKTVEALTKAVEIRDPYTTGHQDRVTMIALLIAERLKITPVQVTNIKLAGPVHDIGKIYVPPEFLTKPTELSTHEFSVIKDHCIKGYDILKEIPFSSSIATIVQQHHERMDGSGYPYGLKGRDILIESRIIAVADTLEAMSANRPYRASKGVDAAIEVLEESSGSKLWEPAVTACLGLLKEYNNDISAMLFDAQLGMIKLPDEVSVDETQLCELYPCWEYMRCKSKEECPAYPDNGFTCSVISGTECGEETCSVCDYRNSPYFNSREAEEIHRKNKRKCPSLRCGDDEK